MFQRLSLCLLPLSLFAAESLAPGPLAVPAGQVVATPPPDALAAASDQIAWPEAGYTRYAEGSVVDAQSWLSDAPAGHHGWLRTRADGRLEFADGAPARFWGTTLCFGATFPAEQEDVERLATMLAACGYNLVRFHHNDIARIGLGYLRNKSKDGTVTESASELDPVGMERLDRLAAACIKHGIYIYLDCVDSRPWTADVGMPGWEELAKGAQGGWKGVWPHPTMIAAWKRAVTALLAHRNPFTSRTWGEEPAVAVVEALNENGPFWDWGFTITDALRQWHVSDWNQWLKDRYGDRTALAKRWTDVTGSCGLQADEDPAQGTVYKPALFPLQEWDRPNASKARGPCRLNDYYAYLAERTVTLHQTTAAHIRSLGFKGLVVGSHELQGPINQQAEIAATGTIAAHLYANPRMAWGTRPGMKGVVIEGVDVKANNWYVNIPRIKAVGVSSWNSEWTGGSTAYRADVNLAVAGAHAFQHVDGSAQFAFMSHWVGEPMPNYDWTYRYHAYQKKISLGYAVGHDPSWTAANRVAAALVLRGDLPSAKYRVHLAYSAEDVAEQNLHAAGVNGGSGTIGGASLFLPLLHEVDSAFFDQTYAGDADVVFSTGRSASGDYSKAKHAVMLGHNPWCDRYRQKRDLAAPARLLAPALRTEDLAQPTTFNVTWPYATARSITIPRVEAALLVASLPAGATPIAVSADGKYALGWCDDRFLVLPNAAAYGEAIGDARWLYRAYLAAAKRWKLDLAGNDADASEYHADNGRITTDWGTGSQLIDSPKTQIIAGFIGYRTANTTSNLAVRVDTAYAAIALTSSDALPIASSKRLLLVAAGRVSNTGQEYVPAKGGGVELGNAGKAPTLVEGLHGELRLQGLTDASLQVFALDSAGRRLGEVPATRSAGALTIALSPRWRTIWFEVCAPGTAGPAAPAGEAWPAAEAPPLAAAPAVKSLPVGDYLAKLNQPAKSAEEPAAVLTTDGLAHVALTDVATWKPFQGYGNLKFTVGEQAGVPAATLLVGQHTKDWSAGVWANVTAPKGVVAASVAGLGLWFQGDGTAPRECFVSLKLADGSTWKSRNLTSMCEDTAWREVVLQAADFSAKDKQGAPDLATITRIDLAFVGPLMDSRSTFKLGAFSLLTRGAGEARVERFGANLPVPQALSSPTLSVPLVADATLTADGDPSEPAWAKAVALAMDEAAVPAWQKLGSFVADGVRKQDEKARFWLLATPSGLGLIADIEKGVGAPVAGKEWWLGDCLEVFSDVGLARKKPTKQLFVAYRRPGADHAASSAPGATVGRVRTARGYALEALIPWTDLGFTGVPTADFGLDLQVDVGDSDGRRLQLVYATGTNEAWITAEHFLTVHLVK